MRWEVSQGPAMSLVWSGRAHRVEASCLEHWAPSALSKSGRRSVVVEQGFYSGSRRQAICPHSASQCYEGDGVAPPMGRQQTHARFKTAKRGAARRLSGSLSSLMPPVDFRAESFEERILVSTLNKS
mmetsp:Transcript_84836/g.273172  ORF Transcript_84836/g.273172 Transcript_84836/m.273172 type:complete len:127 (-) Transcript_84836:101-481(-)